MLEKIFIKIIRHKEICYCLLAILINIVVYFRWFSFSFFEYADWNFSFSDRLKELLVPTVWTIHTDGLGSLDLAFWKLPINVLYGIFGLFHFDSNVPDVFIAFVPIVLILPLVGFRLIKKITKSNEGAFVGSLVISFNTYLLAISTQGHLMINISFVFCLLTILFFINALENNGERKFFLLSVLSLLITTFYDLRITYITAIILSLYFVYNIFIVEGDHYRFKKRLYILSGFSANKCLLVFTSNF